MPRVHKAREGDYIRDGRSPIPESAAISRAMSAIKGKDTALEIRLRRALWKAGMKGYRTNVSGLPGRPDIVFTKHHLAIFVNGCYWHRCPRCDLPPPRSHSDFWSNKFTRNRERDVRVLDDLKMQNWRTMVIWECEVRDDLGDVVQKVRRALEG